LRGPMAAPHTTSLGLAAAKMRLRSVPTLGAN
jgi:hypothetical protein